MSFKNPMSNVACTVCANLRRMFTDSKFIVDQGLLDAVLQTPCSGHDPLLHFIRDDFQARNGESHMSTKDYRDKDDDKAKKGEKSSDDEGERKSGENGEGGKGGAIEKPGPGPYNIHFVGKDRSIKVEMSSTSRSVWNLLLARSRDEPEIDGFGRVLDPDWVDLELVKRWKTNCISQHGEKCRNPLRIQPVSPAWLIDVVRNCLVAGSGITEYVALSYRWGSSDSFRMTSQLLQSAQERGSLSPSRFGNEIAPTVLHAIRMTHAIDEQYLWVDAICIVQDDSALCAEQLQKMGAIYATAELTIVASDGDAMNGITGLKGISPARKFDQRVIPVLENEKVIIRQEAVVRAVSGASEYFTRGWTFQEFYLSKRRLTFAKSQVHWHCACTDWHEDLIQHGDAHDNEYINMDTNISCVLQGQPDPMALTHLLGEFNHRKLSFPGDALPAISGFLAVISRSYEGGFLFGLPETCFDAALMWRSPFAQDMEKRHDAPMENPLAMASRVPSWSWVAWEGTLLVLQEESLHGQKGYKSRTIPITQWYTHKTPNTSQKRIIRSNWFHVRQTSQDATSQLPDGWKREEYDVDKHGEPPEGLGQFVYRHPAIDGRYFWLPVPISTIVEEAELFTPEQTPYISCITKRGWFTAGRFPRSYLSDFALAFSEDLFHFALLGENNIPCGQLYLQTEADGDDLVNPNLVPVVELVAVCRRRITVSEARWKQEGENTKDEGAPRLGDVYKDVYGVLWVEWKDGVAYRKASGLVEKNAWERHQLQDVHLVLG